MKVWKVHQGCKYEGGSCIGVFSSKQEAIMAAEKYVKINNLTAELHRTTLNEKSILFKDYDHFHIWNRISDIEWRMGSDLLVINDTELNSLNSIDRTHFLNTDLVTYDVGDNYKVHACNTKGVMGRGIALAFKKQYPKSYQEYKDYCLSGDRLGTAFITSENMVCLITSANFAPPDSPKDIINNTKSALNDLLVKAESDKDFYSNRFNSGLFSVDWMHTFELIQDFLKNTNSHWIIVNKD